MKVLLIGATGTIGKAVAERLSGQHQIIAAGFRDGDVQVDLGSPESIKALFEQVGKVDAVISTAGLAAFGPLAHQSDDDYQLALNNKLMGQVNLVRLGSGYLNDGGSITLTSGILSRQPMPGSASVSMVNGALESFVKAAALELNGVRVNAVAPAFVKETMAMMGMDTSSGISAADTAKAYEAAVSGEMSGETLDAPNFL
ncbi:NAD(P)-dependent dehydrogenase, short-chain alcohol dehydrogenase family [Ferrimonas sediminum]|uniref:NAD(P)-dependent dehydrogenase, short-chain alcohol dehydrogenase family n=1 Tax=Ferrimonas sediminum TaxID=718193 RepID=A0A1G8YCV2_9GAMM|nr:short chain dehydrogenase [Ferrimonas sediminum]SDK00055.1 NAD(P)-dependent dehydrogenase, short-chain alcohol dehydrogenase family [Ferrimonas sediminum]